MSHDEIATGLGISRNTLEKHFGSELYVGGCQKRLDVLDAMQRTAMRGNVAAQKAYLATSGPRAVAPPAESDMPKPEGKKAQAQADAAVAQRGTEWDALLPGIKTVQ